MANWQFSFHVVPREGREPGVVPLTMTLEDLDVHDWWSEFGSAEVLKRDLTQLLPIGISWHPDAELWGSTGGDRFVVWYQGGAIVEMSGRIDLRSLSLPDLSRVTEVLP